MEQAFRQSDLPPVAALAFLGDAVWSRFVRHRLIGQGLLKSGELNRAALAYVTAEAQARVFRALTLTDGERDVARRAGNSGHLNCPKHASGRDYRQATGFEAVLGMLDWQKDAERLDALLKEAAVLAETPDPTPGQMPRA